MRLCSEVAEYKIATGKAVYDAEREKQKIESVQAMAEGEFNKQAVCRAVLQMMTLSRRYQYQTIAGRVGGRIWASIRWRSLKPPENAWCSRD